MNLKDKYSDIVQLVSDQPHYNRKRAIKRFFLLMDFQDNFLPLQQQADSKCCFTKALQAYAKLRNIPERTFVRWLTAYRGHGIMGLLPRYGSAQANPLPPPHTFHASITIDTRAPLGCLDSIRRILERCRSIKPDVKKVSLSVLDRYFNGLVYGSPLTLSEPLNNEEVKVLTRYKTGNHKKYSKKAHAILMANDGRSLVEVMDTVHMAPRTIYRWLSNFNRDRLDSIEVRINAPGWEVAKQERRTRVIDIIHKTPSIYGINRTTWTYAAICEAYEQEYGDVISVGKVAGVVKSTGYSWRRARTVLTSPDPGYKEKVQLILKTLRGLGQDDRFFFLDEVGPYRVKKYGGQRLSLKDQVETIPAMQRGRGKVQFVAALEAVTNQLTWRFTGDKSAISLVRFLEDLVPTYSFCENLYFTWDAISVHNAKAVIGWIVSHNKGAGPHVEVVPLPANAQFLNVIEAVFGGMKRAVICNSDYPSPQDMKEAIARYFEERNEYYRQNPKRAGNKIWDEGTFDIDKLIGGLFKKM